jgi:hypothetical protein
MTRRDAVRNSYPGAETESFSSLGMSFRGHQMRPASSADLLAWLPDLRRLLHVSGVSSHGDGDRFSSFSLVYSVFLCWVDPLSFLKEPHRRIGPWWRL